MKIKRLHIIYIFIFIFCTGLNVFSADSGSALIENEIEGLIFKIISEPSGVEVYINNIFAGTTPLNKLRAKKGKYSVKLFKLGYKELNTVIDLTNQDQEFKLNLEKLPWEPLTNNLSLKYFIPFFSKIEKEVKMSFFFAYRYHFPLNHDLSNFSIEAITGLINMNLKYSLDGVANAGETTLTIVPLALNFHYNFFRRFPYISPYIGIGFGACIINTKVDKYEKTSLTFSLIGGLNFFTNWPVSFQIEVIYSWLGKAKIPVQATGSVDNITLREEYFFKGFFVSISVVGRF